MKKYLFVLAFIFLLSLPVSAYSDELLVDIEGLLTADENNILSDLLCELSDSAGIDIAVVTVESFDGMSAQAYAEAFYDGVGYGRGEYNSGILLLVSVAQGEYFISTNGYAYHTIDSYELDDIENALLDGLSSGDYYTAFTDFATLSANAVDVYDSYENGYEEIEDDESVADLMIGIAPISVGIGFVISFILVMVKKAKMTTVKPVNTASNYIVNNSLNLTHQSDRYLYSTVTRTKKSSSSSGSHGSSIGRSSGGFSGRGGRGGRF